MSNVGGGLSEKSAGEARKVWSGAAGWPGRRGWKDESLIDAMLQEGRREGECPRLAEDCYHQNFVELTMWVGSVLNAFL